ncbi:MAG: nitrilase family protein [Phototrophicaceae bacterium]
MREITIAIVQMKPILGEPEENLVKMSEKISEIASKQKVDLIVFPELITSGNELGLRFTEIAQRVPGPTVNLLAQRANDFGIYIAFGIASKEKVESVLYNTAILVGPDGELVEAYNKVHLRGEERMAFREGYKIPVAETELGTIGLCLGYDLAYPEVARSMTLEGAEIICAMANWEASNIDEWKTYLRARAYENSVFIAGANRVGEDVTLTFGGESMVVGPRGEIYASLSDETDEETGAPLEGVAIAKIDLDEVRKNREEYQFLQTRQPASYRSIVRKY